MDSPNRINPTAMTLTLKRQTPKNEFGQVLASTLQGAVKTGSAIVGALAGSPVISAAVSSVSTVTGAVSARSGASAGSGVVTLGGGTSAAATGAGSAPGSLAGESTTYTNPDVQQMAQMSDYYLHLQNEMQQESREYNAVSNIIKVRHDSAKAAINNIR